MVWSNIFKAAIKLIAKHKKKIAIGVKMIWEISPKIKIWWSGIKLSIIGPTAAGKNCLYNRMRGESIPNQHIQTRGLTRVNTFHFKMSLGDGRNFNIKCKGALNVGGEKDERERNWFEACQGSDVVFYIVDIRQVIKSTFSSRTRIYSDMKWLATNIKDFRKNTCVHILVNKVDLILDEDKHLADIMSEYSPQIDKFEKMSKSLFGAYEDRLTGATFTSMKDDHLYSISFPNALESVYEAVHK